MVGGRKWEDSGGREYGGREEGADHVQLVTRRVSRASRSSGTINCMHQHLDQHPTDANTDAKTDANASTNAKHLLSPAIVAWYTGIVDL